MLNNKATFILIDPEKESDKTLWQKKADMIELNSNICGILLGGSTLNKDYGEQIIRIFKQCSSKSIIGFPGSHKQIYPGLDGVLFLNYLNSDDSKYTRIESVSAAKEIRELSLPRYSCAYIIINTEVQNSSTLKVTKSNAFHPVNDVDEIMNRIAYAYYSGQKHLYLEAGSGSDTIISLGLIEQIKAEFDFYIMVGGGIKNAKTIADYHKLGANAVVVGTAVEKNPDLIADL